MWHWQSRQKSRGIGIAKFAGAAPLRMVELTDNTGVARLKGVPPVKVMSLRSGGIRDLTEKKADLPF